MGYRTIKPEIRTRAVLDLIAGKSVLTVSRRYGVTRSTLYNWRRVVGTLARNYFRGPPSREKKSNGEQAALERQEERIRILEKQLTKRKGEAAALRGQLAGLRDIARPRECGSCGCGKIYKVGYYEITTDYFTRHLAGGDRKIKVLHFTCAACRKSFSVVDPFHNVFMLSPDREEGVNGDWILQKAKAGAGSTSPKPYC